MADANEPTAKSPNAPKQDKMAAARAAKADKQDRISVLEEQLAALTEKLNAAPMVVDDAPGPEAAPEQIPGEYIEDGKDQATGRPIYRKRRWTMDQIRRRYESVTFTPMLNMPVKPHGVKPGWELTAGQVVTVPNIVKAIYENSIAAIKRQSAYRGASPEQAKAVFDAAKKQPGPHWTPIEHVGFGWPEEALKEVAAGRGNDPKAMEEIGWEPESGFPGGFGGKALPPK